MCDDLVGVMHTAEACISRATHGEGMLRAQSVVRQRHCLGIEDLRHVRLDAVDDEDVIHHTGRQIFVVLHLRHVCALLVERLTWIRTLANCAWLHAADGCIREGLRRVVQSIFGPIVDDCMVGARRQWLFRSNVSIASICLDWLAVLIVLISIVSSIGRLVDISFAVLHCDYWAPMHSYALLTGLCICGHCRRHRSSGTLVNAPRLRSTLLNFIGSARCGVLGQLTFVAG